MARPSETTVAATPKGLALHIGLNLVSAAAYGGWEGPLAACEFDANDMAAVAESKGIKATVLLTREAFTDPDEALAQLGAAAEATALVGRFEPGVVLISGCQDNQTSMDGEHNGAFTGQLLKVWNRGTFAGDYNAFHTQIRAGLPRTQSPNLFVLGPTGRFVKQKPFTV